MFNLFATNPLQVINKEYKAARKEAMYYIMDNCGWSCRTYYRKMENFEKITATESMVIAEAFKKFIHQPLMKILTNPNLIDN
ncbi:MAG: hypothetical protein IT251_03515 [Chitinophagaceae bacterium]|nr:hypothetical protein [Chitinophagaceae bacterium]